MQGYQINHPGRLYDFYSYLFKFIDSKRKHFCTHCLIPSCQNLWFEKKVGEKTE